MSKARWRTPSQTNLAVKTADESITSSTTLQNDDDLKLRLPSNSIWIGTFTYWWEGHASGDIKWDWTLPSGATSLFDEHASLGVGNTGIPLTTQISGAAQTGNSMLTALGAIILMGSTSGTIQLQWAQQTSNGTATTMKKGSNLIMHRGD